MSAELRVSLCLAGAGLLFVLLLFLDAMLRRESVKRDLLGRGCEPLHIWWRPLAYWAPGYRDTPFRVVYRDADRRLHKAYCCVRTRLSDSPWGARHVLWIKDELKDYVDV